MHKSLPRRRSCSCPSQMHRHENPVFAGIANDSLTACIITDSFHLPPDVVEPAGCDHMIWGGGRSAIGVELGIRLPDLARHSSWCQHTVTTLPERNSSPAADVSRLFRGVGGD